jgi:hypothetical protein
MIENLREYREDGQIIHDGDSMQKVASLGPISRVTRVKWTHEGRELERSNRFGIFVRIRPQRDALLCIESYDEKDKSNSFTVLNPRWLSAI